MTEQFEGGCLCEAVRYVCTGEPVATVHCCCRDCRKIGGTGHATHTVVPADTVTLTGVLSLYEKVADSGNIISRYFCPTCGSAVYHTRDGLEGLVVLRTSSLDDPEIVKPGWVIYTSSAVSWDHIDPDLPTFEKMSTNRISKDD